MKRFALLLAAAIALAIVLTPGIAFANFAIHGGYTKDTASCAGCHRAHTSFSSVTWTDNQDGFSQRSALLVSNASTMVEFCFACHGNDAQGAETNVEGGQYRGSLYGTHDAALNGGFAGDNEVVTGLMLERTSDHVVNGTWGAYGGGARGVSDPTLAHGDGPDKGMGSQIIMTCASCHDPHGSSNYRILADQVNGIGVGGYNGGTQNDPNPAPYVLSMETGYPNGLNGKGVGWRKHEFGNAQLVSAPAYQPNYTQQLYAKGYDTDGTNLGSINTSKGMSGWCVGCHTVYMETGRNRVSSYDAGDDWGRQDRHRHPINITLADGMQPDASPGVAGHGGYGSSRTLSVELAPPAEIALPLANTVAANSAATTNTADDWLECLSCHYAHGTSVTMRGFASVDSVVTDPNHPSYKDGIVPDSATRLVGSTTPTLTGGVPPVTGLDSALLRRPNRGVCETCHDK